METYLLNPISSLCDENIVSDKWTASFALYKNIKNAPEVHKLLLGGKIAAAIINPSQITDVFQVQIAANRAVRSHLLNKMSTKSLHTELLYNLSPEKKIANALQTFGMNPSSCNVLVVVLTPNDEANISDILQCIEGDIVPLSELPSLRDEKSIRSFYKIADQELEKGSLLHSVVGRMACKEFL